MSQDFRGGSSRNNPRADRFTSPQAAAQKSGGRVPGFTVEAMRPLRDAGNLRAVVDLKIGPLIVHGFRVIREEGKAAWVGAPSVVREEPDPSAPDRFRRKWYPLLTLPPAWKEAVDRVVLAAWVEYEETGILPARAIGGGGAR